MPRRKLARRFDPRFVISQSTVDVESNYLAREVENYLLLSTNDLKEKLTTRVQSLDRSDQALQSLVDPLPDRMQLAIRCMLARDFYHIARLYETYLRSQHVDATTAPMPPPTRDIQEEQPERLIPFRETLFEL